MFSARKVRTWYRLHKWTSLLCTLFLLFSCLTGLPLIFHLSENLEISPASGWIPWDGRNSQDEIHTAPLTDKEIRVPVVLNQGVVFREPGQYQVRVSTNRAGRDLTTNSFTIDLEEMPAGMEAERVHSLVAKLHTPARNAQFLELHLVDALLNTKTADEDADSTGERPLSAAECAKLADGCLSDVCSRQIQMQP